MLGATGCLLGAGTKDSSLWAPLTETLTQVFLMETTVTLSLSAFRRSPSLEDEVTSNLLTDRRRQLWQFAWVADLCSQAQLQARTQQRGQQRPGNLNQERRQQQRLRNQRQQLQTNHQRPQRKDGAVKPLFSQAQAV